MQVAHTRGRPLPHASLQTDPRRQQVPLLTTLLTSHPHRNSRRPSKTRLQDKEVSFYPLTRPIQEPLPLRAQLLIYSMVIYLPVSPPHLNQNKSPSAPGPLLSHSVPSPTFPEPNLEHLRSAINFYWMAMRNTALHLSWPLTKPPMTLPSDRFKAKLKIPWRSCFHIRGEAQALWWLNTQWVWQRLNRNCY